MDTKSLDQVFNECNVVLKALAYYKCQNEDRLGTRQIPIACRIYFARIDNNEGCNALGNNLAVAIDDVKEYLELGPRSSRLEINVRGSAG